MIIYHNTRALNNFDNLSNKRKNGYKSVGNQKSEIICSKALEHEGHENCRTLQKNKNFKEKHTIFGRTRT